MSQTGLRIAIAGGTGMIGQAIATHARAAGHEVRIISRRPVPGGILWNPALRQIEEKKLEGLSAVINLAGENLAEGRWTDGRKELLISSRVTPTTFLAEMLPRLNEPPGVFISASAIGIYGNRGDEELSEQAVPGNDFLAGLVREWESAADAAREGGLRVVHPRFGIVLSRAGGALPKLLPSARLGLGGPIGNGAMWWSWVSIEDLVQMILYLIIHADLAGPFNVVSPNPVRQREFAATLGRVLHRPAFIPLPPVALRIALGEMADAALLASTRVVPERAQRAGFVWQQPDLESALTGLLQTPP